MSHPDARRGGPCTSCGLAEIDREACCPQLPGCAYTRPKVTLTDGSPVTPDHRELKENGQQKGYVVLSEEERAKGFVRPVRKRYTHIACGTVTTMHSSIAETYARDPQFYTGTFCVYCSKHFPLSEFRWDDGTELGS